MHELCSCDGADTVHVEQAEVIVIRRSIEPKVTREATPHPKCEVHRCRKQK
jgi:hypothetical protein